MGKKENLDSAINSRDKKCFIVTPIGNDTDNIRRHIDGIIDTVIEPLVNEKGYDLNVAHRITTPGSINKQVISGIYEADLVIANLTHLNPNVMYELAFAHSVGKNTITIAESGTTKLPFDIATERTVFYKNDFKGVMELRESLGEMIMSIELGKDSDTIDNPIYVWLDKSIFENKLVKEIENKKTDEKFNEGALLQYIIQKLDKLESEIISNRNYDKNNGLERISIELGDKYNSLNRKQEKIFTANMRRLLNNNEGIEFLGISSINNVYKARFEYYKHMDRLKVEYILDEIIMSSYQEANKFINPISSVELI